MPLFKARSRARPPKAPTRIKGLRRKPGRPFDAMPAIYPVGGAPSSGRLRPPLLEHGPVTNRASCEGRSGPPGRSPANRRGVGGRRVRGPKRRRESGGRGPLSRAPRTREGSLPWRRTRLLRRGTRGAAQGGESGFGVVFFRRAGVFENALGEKAGVLSNGALDPVGDLRTGL